MLKFLLTHAPYFYFLKVTQRPSSLVPKTDIRVNADKLLYQIVALQAIPFDIFCSILDIQNLNNILDNLLK
jgi:hypothetical protein